MRAAIYREFGGDIAVADVEDPACPPDGVVLRVEANGVCRSDWHGWMGHDPDIRLPHVPGHEMAGVVEAAGPECRAWRPGDRVVVPFILGCGVCAECRAGQPQVCGDQRQPGFTQWGGFAEYVAVPRADANLVRLPDELASTEAAALGCRVTTAYRAVVEQGRVAPGEWLAVHGCGGVGLSAVAIGAAAGARVVAVDIDPAALALAESLGAARGLDSRGLTDVAEAVREVTGGGAHVSLDALGRADICRDSIRGLRPLGRHVQVGLLAGAHADPPLPMGEVIGRELEIRGSHGMAAHRFPRLFELIAGGRLSPRALIAQRLDLAEGAATLQAMGEAGGVGGGIAVIDRFA